MDFKDYVNGWCLRENEETQFWFFRDVMGSPFYCEFCGEIKEKLEDSVHVFQPSKPLLAILRMAANARKILVK